MTIAWMDAAPGSTSDVWIGTHFSDEPVRPLLAAAVGTPEVLLVVFGAAMVFLFIGLGGVVPMAIARARGRSARSWFLLGLLIWILTAGAGMRFLSVSSAWTFWGALPVAPLILLMLPKVSSESEHR
jgi:hypothetical protein